ncbi:MAG TPA: winged helix-turn-helix domain-containing protein, partial [Phenylobacterium sp.]|nr:winged helix-turn-helix domain-containing protein [Phenylobacterium sp.]
MTEATQPPLAVDLAHEPDLRLGGLEISPSGCRLRGPNGEQHIEPRVMEVLVVLARHPGQTVTRDQLIDACWGGRIV